MAKTKKKREQDNDIRKQIYDKVMLGRIKNPVNKIPEQYLIPGASPLASYPSIINEFKDLLTTHKFFAQIKSPYRNEIINTCIDYSKTKNCSYNIRKKRHILEFDESKVSNFLVFMLGSIHSCLDDVLYTCYYVATIDIGDDVIIAIPKTEPNHSKAIEDKLNEYGMSDKFELWGDFNQVYNLTFP